MMNSNPTASTLTTGTEAIHGMTEMGVASGNLLLTLKMQQLNLILPAYPIPLPLFCQDVLTPVAKSKQ